MSAWVLSRYSSILPQSSADSGVMLIGDCRPCDGFWPLGAPFLSPHNSYDRLQPSCTPELDKQKKMDGCIVVYGWDDIKVHFDFNWWIHVAAKQTRNLNWNLITVVICIILSAVTNIPQSWSIFDTFPISTDAYENIRYWEQVRQTPEMMAEEQQRRRKKNFRVVAYCVLTMMLSVGVHTVLFRYKLHTCYLLSI